MGNSGSSPMGASVPVNSQGLEHRPPLEKPINITNNNSSIETPKVPPSTNGIEKELISMNGSGSHDVIFNKDNEPLIGEKTKFEWDRRVPLMDPTVVAMMVEKMEMMKKMKKMGGRPPMNNGQEPNGTVVDGKMPTNGHLHPAPLTGNMTSNKRLPPNGTHPHGKAAPNGAHPMNGKMPPKFPKLLGSTENAVRIVRHMKTVFNSDEVQDLCDEKLDSTDSNMMFKMMQCKLEMEFKFLNDLGMGHLTQLIKQGKLPPVVQLIFICYQDDPEVLKELAFVGPIFSKRPDLMVRKGDAVPNIILRTCSEEAVTLNELHLNKNLPLVVFAASSS
ncbi:uncharacterized protein LOC135153907 [Lytechinus pictus]|uniref:uncharacterized protein LOC135153907 n=1 Tax=Lytechinus pictus TaxID=7653 RepID=UPI0030BA1DDD